MRSSATLFRRLRPALGTWLELSVEAEELDRDAAFARMGEVFAEAARLERVLSFFDPESELGRLNRAAAGEAVVLSPELAEVLALGGRIERLSGRAFRLMPGCRCEEACYGLDRARATRRSAACVFDLGGIAKGYVVDRLFGLLSRRAGPGATVAVNAGGDLRCSERAEGHAVVLRVPARGGERGHSLALAGGAVATSSVRGDWLRAGSASARYPAGVVLGGGGDEHRGASAACVAGNGTHRGASRAAAGGSAPCSASVVAASCVVADALAKVALFGDPHPPWARALGAIEIFLFNSEGEPVGPTARAEAS